MKLRFALLFLLTATTALAAPPNFVIIFLDDSGYGDFHPFGDPPYPTPNVEQLAKDGCQFRNFYVPQAICSASRSALLTGCYPERTRMFGAHGPNARGVDPKYATLGQVLQKKGYATALFGKWHIGDQEATRPHNRGYDETAGLMYSNDMWEFHPVNPKHWGKFPLKYWDNGKVTIERVKHEHQKFLTTWATENAVRFIKKNKDKPFYVHVPHSMPHVPLYVSEKFDGKSGAGLYGDVMMEIDWSVGEIVKAIKEIGAEENTVVVFTSDNGPWITYGNHAGQTPFRESKATSFDGGTRSACIVKYPKSIKPGSISTRTWCTLDVLPTFAKLAGAELPENPVDGKDVWPLITGDEAFKNPHDYYAFTIGGGFQGLITGDGKWKLHLPHRYHSLVTPGVDGQAGRTKQLQIELALFDMEKDPKESANVIEKYPEVADRLQKLAEAHRLKFFAKKK